MLMDKPIFSLRFEANEELTPTNEEMRAFLESPKQSGLRETHGSAFIRYTETLEGLVAFELSRQHGATETDFRDRMYYTVLDHSCFFNRALKAAVEQYAYHLHSLESLDFRKPEAFIKSAEAEMSRYNPKKKDEAQKLVRLQGMVDERKRTLAALQQRKELLTTELRWIARYVRDNLVRIEKLCEAAIVILVQAQLARTEEIRIIADIKADFQERLRDELHGGGLTKLRLETVRQDVAQLEKELSDLLREDVYALTGLYEAIHDHVQKAARELTALTGRLAGKGPAGRDENADVCARIKEVLVSLLSDYRFEAMTAPPRIGAAHLDLLREKREELQDRLFELMQKERRARRDRRIQPDRRKFQDPDHRGPERRSGKDRRTGKSRRVELLVEG